MAERKKNSGAEMSAASSSVKNGSGKSRAGKAAQKKAGSAGKSKKPKKNPAGSRLRDEIIAVFMVALGIFLLISVFTDATGAFGEILGMVMKGLFGLSAYILPFFLIVYALFILMGRMAHINSRSAVFSALLFLDLTLLDSVRFYENLRAGTPWTEFTQKAFYDGYELNSAGVFGMLLGRTTSAGFGEPGIIIIAVAVLVVCIMLIVDTPVSVFFDRLREKRNQRLIDRQEAELQAAEAERELKEEVQPEKPAMRNEAAGGRFREIFGRRADAAAASAEASAQPPLPAAAADEDSSSPFAGLRIKGMSFFRNGGSTGGAEKEPESFKDLPENKRRIMNYVNNDSMIGRNDGGSSAAGNGDELDKYKAADFFYEIKNLPPVEEAEEADEGTPAEPADAGPGPAESAAPQPQMTRSEIKAAAAQGAAAISSALEQAQAAEKKEYKLPPLTLLNPVQHKVNRNEERELAAKAAKLEGVMHDFGVNAHVIDVKKGPAVTRYEIQPATGVKVSSITKLADDIALNLEAKSLRIEAPIPGKAAVGIEIENESSSTVTMREMVDSREFRDSKSKISFVVGEDISGNHVVADLKGMPHILIAGSTGSGKSVCINSMIISMIYKSTPDEVKFILIDPKVVELGNYNGIPHMLIPVVTDPSKAAAALAWAVQEMNDRYKKFAETSVRKLEEYNKKMEKEGQPDKVLPQIVIIIDELADLMMAAAKQVEESICRLAQLARAAGMHLVVATQRPSVDVVTGLIKANIPSRIAFAVSSQVDSRTILDRAGAEKLVGKGDMLYYPLGMSQPVRLQGPFVTDDEVAAVIDFWKEQACDDNAARRILEEINTSSAAEVHQDDGDDEDELLPEAIELVVNSGQASASMLQRRYRIGYNRAGRLIDIMEARGIIGPNEGSRPRKVLISKEEYAARQDEAAGSAVGGQEAEAGVPASASPASFPDYDTGGADAAGGRYDFDPYSSTDGDQAAAEQQGE